MQDAGERSTQRIRLRQAHVLKTASRLSHAPATRFAETIPGCLRAASHLPQLAHAPIVYVMSTA